MRIIAIGVKLVLIGVLAAVPQAWSLDGRTKDDSAVTRAPSTQEIRFHSSAVGRCLDCFVGGVKLRNAPSAPPSASGTIAVPASAAATAIFAELYWVILSDTVPPATETFNGAALARVPCGPVTPSPCWAESFAYAYRADVLPLLTSGDNTLDGFPDSGALNTSPESEGATLVIVYVTPLADKEIIVTCGNDAHPLNAEFFDNPLPVATPAGIGADLYFIGGDGQSPPPTFADEVYWNGAALDFGDAWQGLDPGPGVGMWDSMRFSVFTGPPNTASSATPGGVGDCINWVATVLCTKRGACQATPAEPSTWGRVKSHYGNPE